MYHYRCKNVASRVFFHTALARVMYERPRAPARWTRDAMPARRASSAHARLAPRSRSAVASARPEATRARRASAVVARARSRRAVTVTDDTRGC